MTTVKVTPETPAPGASVPAFTPKIHFIKKRLSVSIQLHNIPDKHINLDVSATHLHLDTLSFSKKYDLKFRYPSKIKVDENDVEVNFSSGVLKIELKIIQILDENTGKLMAFKGKTKAAAKASKAPVKPETPSESEESDVEDGENGLNSDEEVSDEQMDVSAESESSEEPVAPKAKSKTATRSKAPASKETSLKILEEVGKKEESKQKQKLEAEKAKEEFFANKSEQREKVKEAKRALKESTMKKLFAAHEAEKKAAKEPKRSKRVVQFEDEEKVQPSPKRSKAK